MAHLAGKLAVTAIAALLTMTQPAVARDATDTSADALTPRGFLITYEVRFAAFRGELALELLQRDGDDYRIRATTAGRGIARMFMGKDTAEESNFSFTDGRVISRSYKLDDGSKADKNDSEINFDWETGIAHSVYEQELAELPLSGEVYDRISADVVTIMDLRNGNEPRTLYIAEKNDIREYTFEAHGRETIEFQGGELETVKYLRTRTGSSRNVMIWYAPELDYLPVQMEQFKRGKSQITFRTQSYSLAEPPAEPEPLQTATND